MLKHCQRTSSSSISPHCCSFPRRRWRRRHVMRKEGNSQFTKNGNEKTMEILLHGRQSTQQQQQHSTSITRRSSSLFFLFHSGHRARMVLFQLFTTRLRVGVKSEAIVEHFKRKKCIESNKSVQFKLALTCSSGVWKVFLKKKHFFFYIPYS